MRVLSLSSFNQLNPTLKASSKQAPLFGRGMQEDWPGILRNKLQADPAARQAWLNTLKSWAVDKDSSWREMALSSLKLVARPEDIGIGPKSLLSADVLSRFLRPLLSDSNRAVRRQADALTQHYAELGVTEDAGESHRLAVFA